MQTSRCLSATAAYDAVVRGSGFDPTRLNGDVLFETLRRLAMDETPMAA